MEKKTKNKKFISIFTGIICFIISGVCIAIIFFNFSHSYSLVKGNSMYPTLNNNRVDEDYVFISKMKDYSYGDIVVAERNASDGKKRIVKRVIAMEYDKIKIEAVDDRYEIMIIYNGSTEPTILEEDYLPQNYTNKYIMQDFLNYLSSTDLQIESGYLIIPEKSVFVLGDNREDGESFDSADYGPIKCANIIGKVDYVIYGGKWRYFQVFKQMLGL